jgi:hypothetical protein
MVRVIALTVTWLVLVGSTACGGGADSTAENEGLLAELPLFPRATEVLRTDAPALGADGSTLEVVTSVEYSVPSGTAATEVVAFYDDKLGRGWKHCDGALFSYNPSASPGTLRSERPERVFVRGQEVVMIVTKRLVEASPVYRVTVDHKMPIDPCTGEMFS